MCRGASSTSRLTGGEDTQARCFSKLISIKHSQAAVFNSKHMLQWNWTHCICMALLEVNLRVAGASWTWDALGMENSFQKSASQAEGGWWYLVSIAADGKSPAAVKGVRISPSVHILLTLGQTLRDAELWDCWYLTCIQLPSVFNSLQYFSTVLACTQLLVATDENFTGGWRKARTPHKLFPQLYITFEMNLEAQGHQFSLVLLQGLVIMWTNYNAFRFGERNLVM